MDTSTNKWSAGRKFCSRFFAVYFILYVLSYFAKWMFSPLTHAVGTALKLPTDKLHSAHNGSGDSTYQYLLLLCVALLTPVVTLIWSVLDRRRANYVLFCYWTEVMVRYVLAFFLLVYGFGKITGGQFGYPPLHLMLQPFGDSSPMGVAWRFMGYSYSFSVFTGIAEITGGLLLLFWRTRIFGALFSMTVMCNVVAINFCYDVPVKIFSSHLFFMAVYVAAGDTRRLFRFFLQQKPVELSTPYLIIDEDWLMVRKVMKVIMILILAATVVAVMEQTKNRMQEVAVHPPLYGIYNVERFVRNNDTLQPLITDTTMWRQLIVEQKHYALIRMMSDKKVRYNCTIDTAKRTIIFSDTSHNTSPALSYQLTDTAGFIIHGRLLGDSVYITMRKKDPKDFLLNSRGFHWINEYPLNR